VNRCKAAIKPSIRATPSATMRPAMEERISRGSVPATALKDAPVGWRDLRQWLALIDASGRLLRIDQPVDPEEELAAITFMATRRENAPALLFEVLGGSSGARCSPTCLAPARSATRSRLASTQISRSRK
jgi:hypothetical protein